MNSSYLYTRWMCRRVNAIKMNDAKFQLFIIFNEKKLTSTEKKPNMYDITLAQIVFKKKNKTTGILMFIHFEGLFYVCHISTILWIILSCFNTNTRILISSNEYQYNWIFVNLYTLRTRVPCENINISSKIYLTFHLWYIIFIENFTISHSSSRTLFVHFCPLYKTNINVIFQKWRSHSIKTHCLWSYCNTIILLFCLPHMRNKLCLIYEKLFSL